MAPLTFSATAKTCRTHIRDVFHLLTSFTLDNRGNLQTHDTIKRPSLAQKEFRDAWVRPLWSEIHEIGLAEAESGRTPFLATLTFQDQLDDIKMELGRAVAFAQNCEQVGHYGPEMAFITRHWSLQVLIHLTTLPRRQWRASMDQCWEEVQRFTQALVEGEAADRHQRDVDKGIWQNTDEQQQHELGCDPRISRRAAAQYFESTPARWAASRY
ncbi:hypothetical protein JCM10049v2_005030 [Rhodotorula toruloides]